MCDSGDIVCDYSTVALKWTDVPGNEDGYRVYKSGVLVATEPPNSETLHTTMVGSCADTLVVGSFNRYGESRAPAIGYCEVR